MSEHQHIWSGGAGKPVRCVECGVALRPWWRRWRDRVLTEWAWVRGTLRRWFR